MLERIFLKKLPKSIVYFVLFIYNQYKGRVSGSFFLLANLLTADASIPLTVTDRQPLRMKPCFLNDSIMVCSDFCVALCTMMDFLQITQGGKIFMNFFETSAKGMEKVLRECKEDYYADYIAESLEKWTENKDTSYFIQGFSKKGRFENFSFQNTVFATPEREYWTHQYFGGLVAMALQLAKFEREGKTISIDFIKQHFGHPAEVISGTLCTDCGAREFSMLDIDRYITSPVISGAIIAGLEKGDLSEITEQIMTVSYVPLFVQREQASLRASNSNVSVSSAREPAKVCLKCGGKNIQKCRYLKSLKKMSFVALNK